MTTELDLKEKTHTMLKRDFIKKGEPLWYFHPSDRFFKGLPDYIGVYGGLFWAAEQKKPGKIAEAIQAAILKAMEKCGAYVFRREKGKSERQRLRFIEPHELKDFLIKIRKDSRWRKKK